MCKKTTGTLFVLKRLCAMRHLSWGLTLLSLGLALGNSASAQASSQAGCTAQTCTLQDFEAVRDETETLYGDVLLILSAHERPNLRSNQSEWRRSARHQCNRTAPAGTDLHAPTSSAHHACMIGHYQARRKELRHWLMHGYTVD